MSRVLAVIPEDNCVVRELREHAAICLSGIATDYTWADDFVTSAALKDEALSLARNTASAIRILEGVEEVRASARKQRLFGSLEPIAHAPGLSTINGFGCMIYGHSNFDPESNSYETTHYLVALFIPIFPLARYRVIRAEKGGYRFLGKLPLRKGDRWHLGLVTAALVAMVIGLFATGSQNSALANTTSEGPNAQTSAPLATETSELSNLKTEIDSGRTRIETLKIRVQPVLEQLQGMDQRLDPMRAAIDGIKQQHDAGSKVDVDEYNTKVRAYNALLRHRRALFAANEGDLTTYKQLIDQDSNLVDQYNARLKEGSR